MVVDAGNGYLAIIYVRVTFFFLFAYNANSFIMH